MQLELFAEVKCECCGETTFFPHVVPRFYAAEEKEHNFCNEKCATDYYLKKLYEGQR